MKKTASSMGSKAWNADLAPSGMWFGLLLWLLFFCLGACNACGGENQLELVVASGRVVNSQGKGIEGVRLSFWLEDKPLAVEEQIVTSRDGTFEATLEVPPGRLPLAALALEPRRHSYGSPGLIPLLLSGPTAWIPKVVPSSWPGSMPSWTGP